MNKNELVNLVSERIEGGKSAASSAVDAVFEAIQETVSRGEKVAITGFGVFEKVERAARTGRNPATGERVEVKAASVPKFRPGTTFRAYVSGAQELVRDAVSTAASTALAAAGLDAGSAMPASRKQVAVPDSPEPAAEEPAPPNMATPSTSTPSTSTPSMLTAAEVTADKVRPAKSTPAKSTAPKPTAAKSPPAKSTAATSTAARKTAATATPATKKVAKKAPARKKAV